MSYGRPWRRWGVAGCVLIVWAGVTPWAAEGQVPDRDAELTLRDELGYHRVRYCWTHWWEVHREDYLYAAQGPATLGDEAAAAVFRERALAALLTATEADSAALRAAAALSLGRIGDPRALPALRRLGEERVHEDVRRSAWVAMGLLNTDESRDALPEPDELFGQDADAWLTAVALLDEADDLMPAVKRMLWDDPMFRTRRRAAHVLRIHKPPDLREVMHQVLRESTDERVVDEAILALGEVADHADLDLLIDLARGRGEARQLPVYQRQARSRPGAFEPQLPGGTFGRLRSARSRLRPARPANWASAAIALGHFTDLSLRDRERVREVLRENFSSVGMAGASLQHSAQGASILALERVGSRRDIVAVRRAVQGRNLARAPEVVAGGGARRNLRLLPPWEAGLLPTRSYAAIALGLHMRALGPEGRPIEEVHEAERAQHIRELGIELGNYLRNPSQPNHFRAACALALGLGGDRANIPRLMEAAEAMEGGDELVLGYTLLALGLLGEGATVRAAAKFIGPPIRAEQLPARVLERRGDYYDWFAEYRQYQDLDRDPVMRWAPPPAGPPLLPLDQPERRLAMRAIVHALAALGDERAAPALIGEWGRDYFVSLEIARALARCGHYEITDPLIGFLEDPRFEDFARLAALSLGQLFDRDDPPRLNRLLEGNNYQAVVRFPYDGRSRSEELTPTPEAVEGIEAGGLPAVRRWRPDTRGFANELLYHYLYTQQPMSFGFRYTR